MKKKLLIVMILAVSVVVAGCYMIPSTEEITVISENESQATMEENEYDSEMIYAEPQNEMGLSNLNIGELKSLAENKKAFYLFIYGGEAVPFDYEEMKRGVNDLFTQHDFPFGFYYVDLTILSENEHGELEKILMMEPAAVAEGVETYAGLYAFKDGKVKNARYDFVPGEEEADIANRVINFVFESNLFINDHGWDVVTYEQLCEKRDSGEKFMVYIGRDTCPYCVPFAKSLMAALDKENANVPVYYFYTQSFKTAINDGVDGAQAAWDSVKADIGFQFTPSLLVFEGGKQIRACESGVDDEYFEMSDEEKKAARDALATEIELWLMEYGLTGAVA